MKFTFDYMPFRSCAICLKLVFRQLWLCESCFEQMHFAIDKESSLSRTGLDQVFESKAHVKFYYLWDWSPKTDVLISPFVRSLKGGFPAFALKAWADELICQAEPGIRFSQSIFVPAPPRTWGVKDHAFKIGEALSLRTGAPVLNLLQRPPSKILQKLQSRQQRQKLQFTSLLGGRSRSKLRQMDVHFIDDVVTTGSTARAAWRALGRPPRFHVWSLIYRSRLLPGGQI